METKRLNKIIQELITVRGENKLNISDEVILEQACSYHRGELANGNRFPVKSSSVGDTDSFGKKELGNTNESVKPTDKQLAFLKKNGIKIDPKLTKYEATTMIKNYLSSLEKENV